MFSQGGIRMKDIDIKRLRIDKGMTQQQVADLCNIERANLSRYESKKMSPSTETFMNILDVLGYKITVDHSKQYCNELQKDYDILFDNYNKVVRELAIQKQK